MVYTLDRDYMFTVRQEIDNIYKVIPQLKLSLELEEYVQFRNYNPFKLRIDIGKTDLAESQITSNGLVIYRVWEGDTSKLELTIALKNIIDNRYNTHYLLSFVTDKPRLFLKAGSFTNLLGNEVFYHGHGYNGDFSKYTKFIIKNNIVHGIK